MVKVLCDTNIIISLFDRGGEQRDRAVRDLSRAGMGNIYVSAVTEMEVIKGIRDRDHERQVLKKLESTNIVPLEGSIGAVATGLLREYHLSHGLHILDGLIAATSLLSGLPLFTYNTRDFRFIRELRLYIP